MFVIHIANIGKNWGSGGGGYKNSEFGVEFAELTRRFETHGRASYEFGIEFAEPQKRKWAT